MKTHETFPRAISEIHSRPALPVTAGSLVMNAAVLVDETRDKSTGLHETISWAQNNGFSNAHQTDKEALLRHEHTTIKWERHIEFINITVVAPLTAEAQTRTWLNGILTAQRDAGSLISQSRFDIRPLDADADIFAAKALSDELLHHALPSAQVKIWVNNKAHMIQTALQNDANDFVRYRLDVINAQPDRIGRLVGGLLRLSAGSYVKRPEHVSRFL